MSTNVTYFPMWKKDATAEERFLELAQMAHDDPGRFEKVIIGWIGTKEGKPDVSNYISAGCTALDALGLVALTQRNIENWNIET